MAFIMNVMHIAHIIVRSHGFLTYVQWQWLTYCMARDENFAWHSAASKVGRVWGSSRYTHPAHLITQLMGGRHPM